jgi:hypothetical protein
MNLSRGMETGDRSPDFKLLDGRIESALQRHLERLGGGSHSGGMDAWQTSVENRLGSLDQRLQNLDAKIDRNFLVTWGGVLAVALMGVAATARIFGFI